MKTADWLVLITLATSGIQKLIELLNWLKANQPAPDEEVSQEQLDAANEAMNKAVAAWDAAGTS